MFEDLVDISLGQFNSHGFDTLMEFLSVNGVVTVHIEEKESFSESDELFLNLDRDQRHDFSQMLSVVFVFQSLQKFIPRLIVASHVRIEDIIHAFTLVLVSLDLNWQKLISI